MKLITELNEDVRVIQEGSDGDRKYYIEGVFMQSGIKNRNGRVYPPSILEGAVERYRTEKLDRGMAVGELGHPSGPSINLERVSHKIVSLKREGNDYVGRALLITENEPGRIAKNLMDAGVRIGVSSRGMGSLEPNQAGIMEVQKDFFLATAADIVADPSAPDAFVNGVMEGVDWVWNSHGTLVQRVLEDTRQRVETATAQRELTVEAKATLFERFVRALGESGGSLRKRDRFGNVRADIQDYSQAKWELQRHFNTGWHTIDEPSGHDIEGAWNGRSRNGVHRVLRNGRVVKSDRVR